MAFRIPKPLRLKAKATSVPLKRRNPPDFPFFRLVHPAGARALRSQSLREKLEKLKTVDQPYRCPQAINNIQSGVRFTTNLLTYTIYKIICKTFAKDLTYFPRSTAKHVSQYTGGIKTLVPPDHVAGPPRQRAAADREKRAKIMLATAVRRCEIKLYA